MGADGLGTEGKLEGYCFGSLTGCDQPKNFVFAVGEQFMGQFRPLAAQVATNFSATDEAVPGLWTNNPL